MRITRTRGLALVTVAAIAASFFAVVPAPADPISCQVRQGFKWCDEHWRWEDLPIAVSVNTSGLPAGVSQAQFIEAVRGAIDAWELPAKLLPLTPSGGDCPSGTRVLCYKGTTTTVGKAVDGKTVVLFGAVTGSSIGEARWCFIGTNCTGSKQFRDVDVILESSGVSWRQASPAEAATGELGGPFGPYRCNIITCPGWYDLQSIVTHELGHVLGLGEAEGDVEGCFPSDGEWASDLSDVVNFTQTMYPCHWKGLTNRRTIDVGDLAGLVAVFLGSRLDS